MRCVKHCRRAAGCTWVEVCDACLPIHSRSTSADAIPHYVVDSKVTVHDADCAAADSSGSVAPRDEFVVKLPHLRNGSSGGARKTCVELLKPSLDLAAEKGFRRAEFRQTC
jgi:hypothetical protein